MKNSFILYHSYKRHLAVLSNEQKGVLLDAIFEYSENEIIPELEPILQLAFNFIKEDIDMNKEKWEETVEVRSRAGKKGAEARWEGHIKEVDTTKNGKRILRMANDGKNAVSVSVSVSDSVSENGSVISYNKRSMSCLSNPILYEKLATKLGISTKYAQAQCERMEDWLKSKGKTQKDYEAFARNWIRRNMDDKVEVEKPRPTL